MKITTLIFSLLLTGILFVNSNCKKENSCENCISGNVPPIANAGTDKIISSPIDSVMLDGSNSRDPDGNITNWNWSKISGPASFTIINPTSSLTPVRNLDTGIYRFELKVTDNGGLSTRDTVEVKITGSTNSNRPPIANAGADQVIILPNNSVTLDGSSSTDPDNNISGYTWSKIQGPAIYNLLAPFAVQTQLTGLIYGSYLFELKVTDAGGLFSLDTVQIIVDSVFTSNHPPVANAGSNQLLTLPTNNTILNGSGSSDPENNIVAYLWAKISGPSSYSITNTNAMQTQVTNLMQGTYQFELKVTDAGGLFSKDTVLILVNQSIQNSPPVANAGPDITITLPTNIATLNGSGSYDPDNNISSYVWKKIAGPGSFLISNPTAVQTQVNNLVLGGYQFELTVTDSGGLISRDTCNLSVIATTPTTIILENRTWIFPWHASIEINNFHSIVPYNINFKIFIKRDSNPNWIEVFPIASGGAYNYFIETRPNGGGIYNYGSLYILYYGTDVSDTPDVKIEF